MQSWQVKVSLYNTDTQLQCQVSNEILLITGANSHMLPHTNYQYKHLKSQNIVFTRMQYKVVSLNLVLEYVRYLKFTYEALNQTAPN